MMIQQTVGDLVIVFAKTIASAKKKDIDDPWGFTLGRTQKHGIVVQSVESDSLFARTGLMAHQKILTFNGRPCPQNITDAVALLMKAGPRLTIEAIDQDSVQFSLQKRASTPVFVTLGARQFVNACYNVRIGVVRVSRDRVRLGFELPSSVKLARR